MLYEKMKQHSSWLASPKPTSLPCWHISVGVVIFLFVSQITGINCDCGLDFLLSNFHTIIKNFEEFF
uniref:Uncharacterized protein n=1 Tax=Pseudonaja textilis TaxID=8673 RepID=A0A670Y3K5_PSETE